MESPSVWPLPDPLFIQWILLIVLQVLFYLDLMLVHNSVSFLPICVEIHCFRGTVVHPHYKAATSTFRFEGEKLFAVMKWLYGNV